MSKEVVEVWTVDDAQQLSEALMEAIGLAKSEGHDADTIYPNRRRVTLVRETLTDGSHVMNINFFDGE